MITEELLKECRLEFEAYFQSLVVDLSENQYRIDDVRAHSLRVVNNSLLVSKIVLQNDEDKRIAEVIALFHDLGRASLIAKGTASPTNIQRDHALLSVQLVQKMDFYAKLPVDTQLIIQKSIENHNKLKLPKLDNEQQTLFARLLRDADKLDIFDSSYRFFKEKMGVQPIMTFDLVNTPEVSEKIIKSIMAGKTAAVEDMKTMNDYKLLLISMAFDLNFKYTFRLISEKQYIQKIYETLPKRDQIIDAYRGIKLFVENKFVS
ncbi:MAG: HD domain-containing protein [Prolixibacteraceae bacterium]|nr:HD domain-containing protein [Prolixibacteraceae bacterium]